MKDYKNSPLPFQGQKRYFANRFKNVLLEINQKKNIKIVVDLFGGSGLLSHIARKTLPHAKVLYNDFDDYHMRLDSIKRTNTLLGDIRALVNEQKKTERINKDTKEKILARIAEDEKMGFVDYITLSSSLLFSGQYVTTFEQLKNETFYNNIRIADYPLADDYLQNIEIVKQDYRVLYERYRGIDDVLFIIDPPYLTTDTSSYSSGKYWKLGDYLDVLSIMKNINYVYFTSNKSSIIDLCEWISENYNIKNPFSDAELLTHINPINKTSKYTDMMYWKVV